MSNGHEHEWASRERETQMEMELQWQQRMLDAQSEETQLTENTPPEPAPKTTQTTKPKLPKWVIPAAAVVVALLVLLLLLMSRASGGNSNGEQTQPSTQQTEPIVTTTAPEPTTVPTETTAPTTLPPETTAPAPVVYVNPFTDLDENAVWYKPVLWAVHNGIVNGTSETTFSPNEPCLRGQMVTMLWRAAGKPEPTRTTSPFEDVPQDSPFFKAVLWAYENGIAGGTDATHFGTQELCNRGQVITFLYRAAGSPTPVVKSAPFIDVHQDAFYYDAVRWAYENSISSGVSATEFGVDVICSRSQIATLLYRAYNNG